MISKVSSASCGVSPVEESDVVGMLLEMRGRLIDDFAFGDVKLVGEGDINRTTEPLVRFLVWLERTPEAEAALRLAFQRLAGRFRH